MQLEPIPDDVLRTALKGVTGENALLVSDLRWDLKKPCGDCPFAKSSPYHQGTAENLVNYLESIDAGTFGHTCHKTDNREPVDGPKDYDGPTQHCAGALIMLLKSKDKWIQRPLIQAMDAKKFNVAKMCKIAKRDRNVYTIEELAAFYLRELEQRLSEAEALDA